MKDYLAELRTTIWRTAGARYNAARRLKRKELFSTVSLTFFSVITICLAVIQKIYSSEILRSPSLDNYLTALSILSGIFLLAISLMEWGARNGSNADALHKNAEELNALQRRLQREIFKLDDVPGNWSACGELSDEYEAIQSRYDVNHAPLDDQLFLAERRLAPEFISKNISSCQERKVRVVWFFSSIWYYLLFWIVSIIALIPVILRLSLN
ncbi:SLATT domain-containing protein [Pseudomonas lurida]|uniref:SLATT domain-containing protein n=1 Tax=Pseudomonas lurida TaxID=244566 RepID=UPI0015E43CDB|nr:SLATT domain-containing protein [Pseudomonas lurida]MBA1293755.1 SLATT domain-containing protein [Pseudomonas lurida]